MKGMQRLLDIMAKLRDPERGCPWDKQQTFKSIAPYTVEEAYEVADAIEREDHVALREELGDLLLQVVYHARMAEEQGLFAFEDVAAGIGDKLVARHPHVFGDGRDQGCRASDPGLGDTQGRGASRQVPRPAPWMAWRRDCRVSPAPRNSRSAPRGWVSTGRNCQPVFAKIREEIAELEHE